MTTSAAGAARAEVDPMPPIARQTPVPPPPGDTGDVLHQRRLVHVRAKAPISASVARSPRVAGHWATAPAMACPIGRRPWLSRAPPRGRRGSTMSRRGCGRSGSIVGHSGHQPAAPVERGIRRAPIAARCAAPVGPSKGQSRLWLGQGVRNGRRANRTGARSATMRDGQQADQVRVA